jgi:hypothetical protein
VAEEPRNLPEWLDVATRHLVPSAQARIRSEIEAHYAESVHSHQSHGSPESEAQTAALAELGSAQVAAWRFGREHLTTGEAETVFREAEAQISLGTIWGICNVLVVSYPNPVGPEVGLLCTLSAILIYYTFRVLVRRSRKVVTRRMVNLLLSILWLNIGGFVWMIHFDQADDQVIHRLQLFMAVGFCLMAAGNSLSLLRLRRKLAVRIDGDQNSAKGMIG